MPKQLKFDEEARAALLKGINIMAAATYVVVADGDVRHDCQARHREDLVVDRRDDVADQAALALQALDQVSLRERLIAVVVLDLDVRRYELAGLRW